MNIILLGPPGIGKGTQAIMLSEKLGIPKITTGDIMREEAKNGTELGKKVEDYMNRGELVPDRTVIKIMSKRLSSKDCKKGFVLDGFPRTLVQAGGLEKITKIDLVLNLSAPKKDLIERMAGRLTCRSCGSIYHRKYSPPKKPNVCDACGGGLYRREDQKESIIKKRLEVYERQTKPLTEYYKKRGLLKNINAEGTKEEVAKTVGKVIKNFMVKSK